MPKYRVSYGPEFYFVFPSDTDPGDVSVELSEFEYEEAKRVLRAFELLQELLVKRELKIE